MASTSQAAEPAAPHRVLLVDDEAAVLRLVKTMLTRHEYQVVTAVSGNDGLKLLDEDAFDCIITDAVMPVMSGYDFVRAVRRHPLYGETPVLMLTRKRHRQDVKKAVEAGVTDYVLKPIDEHLLLDKVELCMKKGGGKRHIFECAIHAPESVSSLQLDIRITSMSETDITMRVPLPVHTELPFMLRAPLFEEIGIGIPLLKLIKCDEANDPQYDGRVLPYEVKYSFVGVQEADLRKIRAWLQRQAIQRRK